MVPEILPPEPNSVRFWRWTVTAKQSKNIKIGVSIPCFAIAGWLLQNFLQLRGVVDLRASRIDLAFFAAILFIQVFILTAGSRHTTLYRWIGGLVVVLAVFGLDWWAPKPSRVSCGGKRRPESIRFICSCEPAFFNTGDLHRERRNRNGVYLQPCLCQLQL